MRAPEPSKSLLLAYGVPLLVLLAFTLPHLDQGDFRKDTGLYGAIGLHAWETGNLLNLQIYPGRDYFNKPPLAIWIHGWALKEFGVNLIAARLPSILAASLSLLCACFIGRRFLGATGGLLTGLVTASTYDFFRRVREISLDHWQLAFVMLACAIFVSMLQSEHRSGARFLLVGVMTGLALLCKPLNALILFPVLTAWCFLFDKKTLISRLWLIALPAALIVAGSWHTLMIWRYGQDFTSVYFGSQIVGRFRGELGQYPWYYYFVVMANGYWPWMLGFLPFLFKGPSLFPREVKAAWIWIVPVFVAVSAMSGKSPSYLLPVFPFLSLVVAVGLLRVPAIAGWISSAKNVRLVGFLALIAGVVISLLPIRFQNDRNDEMISAVKYFQNRNIDFARVEALDFSPSDVCRLYLIAGKWPLVDSNQKPLGCLWRKAHDNLTAEKSFGPYSVK